MRTTLSHDQWQAVAPHWLGRECDRGPTGPGPRMFVEAVPWIARTGCQWRDPPEEFGKENTVFKRFRRWEKADAFYRMFRVLAEDADFECTTAPLSCIYTALPGNGRQDRQGSPLGTGRKSRAHSQAIGRFRGGMTSKILALIDFRLPPPPRACEHALPGNGPGP